MEAGLCIALGHCHTRPQVGGGGMIPSLSHVLVSGSGLRLVTGSGFPSSATSATSPRLSMESTAPWTVTQGRALVQQLRLKQGFVTNGTNKRDRWSLCRVSRLSSSRNRRAISPIMRTGLDVARVHNGLLFVEIKKIWCLFYSIVSIKSIGRFSSTIDFYTIF